MNKVIIVVLVIIVAVGGIIFFSSKPQKMIQNQQPAQQVQQKPLVSPVAQNTSGTVIINNFTFSPSALTIKVGTQISWINQDSTPHQVISDSNSEVFKSAILQKGQGYTFVFTKAGTYSYHCSTHPSMIAKIVVQ